MVLNSMFVFCSYSKRPFVYKSLRLEGNRHVLTTALPIVSIYSKYKGRLLFY